MKGVIIVLGNTNDTQGHLSDVALSRVRRALKILRDNPNHQLLLTGGFGWNFDRAEKPHWFYLKQFFLKHKVSEKQILDTVSSHNTFQDLVFVKQVLQKKRIKNIIVVTSDFHMPRAKLLCRKIFGSGYHIQFETAHAKLGVRRRLLFMVHELVGMAYVLFLSMRGL